MQPGGLQDRAWPRGAGVLVPVLPRALESLPFFPRLLHPRAQELSPGLQQCQAWAQPRGTRPASMCLAGNIGDRVTPRQLRLMLVTGAE